MKFSKVPIIGVMEENVRHLPFSVAAGRFRKSVRITSTRKADTHSHYREKMSAILVVPYRLPLGSITVSVGGNPFVPRLLFPAKVQYYRIVYDLFHIKRTIGRQLIISIISHVIIIIQFI